MIAEIDERTKRIEHATTRQVFTIPEVAARYLHRSERWARTHRWALPNFGESEIPGHAAAWSVGVCEEWYSVPLHVHEAEWFRKHRDTRRSA